METDERVTEGRDGLAQWSGKIEHVAIVGCGYVGACLGAVLSERGVHVHAVDVDRARIAAFRSGACPVPEPGLAEMLSSGVAAGRVDYDTEWTGVKSADVVVVTVGTPVDSMGRWIDEPLRRVAADLGRCLRPGQLVLLKSTVPPGTARDLASALEDQTRLVCGYDFWVASCPERLAEGEALAQLRQLPVIVGGVDRPSTEVAVQFWRAVGIEVDVVSSAEAAEVVKLASNWWIDANIAIANELAQFCSVHSVDVMEVTRVTNALPKGAGHVNVLLASVGVGGSCLTKDPWMAWESARQHGIALRTVETARRVNDDMPLYACDAILKELEATGRNPAEATVAVLGLGFKNDTGDLRCTPVLPVVEALVQAGVSVRLCDPLADPAEVGRHFGMLSIPTWTDAVCGVDCVAVLAGHQAFAEIDVATLARSAPGCIVFDGRAYYPPDKVRSMREAGLHYCGVGRSADGIW